MGSRPSRAWFLSRPLASVEWALIMQFCPLRDLLRLARCSHTTLSAAAHPVVWSPHRVISAEFSKLPVSFGRSLISQQPISLRWQIVPSPAYLLWRRRNAATCDWRVREGVPAILSPRDLDAVRAIPSLHTLHLLSRCWLDAESL